MSTPLILVTGQAVASILMVAAWLLCKRIGNASYVDALWAFGVGALGTIYLAIEEGDSTRRTLVMGLLALWSLRLGVHLLRRCCRQGIEDSRYHFFRKAWGKKADFLFFLFFQKQAFWIVLFASPFLVVGSNPQELGPLDYAGLLIWIVGFAGVTLADLQLTRFKNAPGRKREAVCDSGLWRFSRHPNYFFEWILWSGYPLLGWNAAGGYWLVLLPLVLLAFLLKITGIPHVEARKIENSGEQYRRYISMTNTFFPWFPKKESSKS